MERIESIMQQILLQKHIAKSRSLDVDPTVRIIVSEKVYEEILQKAGRDLRVERTDHRFKIFGAELVSSKELKEEEYSISTSNEKLC